MFELPEYKKFKYPVLGVICKKCDKLFTIRNPVITTLCQCEVSKK